ncbi:MAG: radical SAM protein, partial [Thermoanaerobaculia bacterium]
YPARPPERTRWILERRGRREALDPLRPAGFLLERERAETGEIVEVATVFLTNRECPWHCLMCDLWTRTLTQPAPAGAIPRQIRTALAALPPARRIKLYNAGSFFDPKAIPPGEYEEIADELAPFDRVIVESHPALVGEACFRFASLLDHPLEVAMGLETVHPTLLPRLNKGMPLAMFRRAADALARRGVALRSFVLVGLPFLSREESLDWCHRSVQFAFDCGSTAVSLIPTRAGNGALDALADRGEFLPPTLGMLEEASGCGIQLSRGCVFADLWDLDRLRTCGSCFAARRRRLETMNLEQTVPAPVACQDCGGGR